MTTAAIVVLILGVAYSWWHKGVDTITAVIFTVFGVCIAQSAAGPAIVSTMNGLGGALFSTLGHIF